MPFGNPNSFAINLSSYVFTIITLDTISSCGSDVARGNIGVLVLQHLLVSVKMSQDNDEDVENVNVITEGVAQPADDD